MCVDTRHALHCAEAVFRNDLSTQPFLQQLCFGSRARPGLLKRSSAHIAFDNLVLAPWSAALRSRRTAW
jgi:hypothetical protein